MKTKSLIYIYINNYLIKWNWRSANWMTCIEHEKENILFGIVPWCSLLVIQKLWSLSMFQTIFLPHQHGRSALDTSRTLFFLASTQGVSCRLVMNHLIYGICICSLSYPSPHIYVSKCMYVYVHISLFLPECACTTIIDISPRIFKLICCCCVSIIIVICIVVVYKS
jgi:hypothetical protein